MHYENMNHALYIYSPCALHTYMQARSLGCRKSNVQEKRWFCGIASTQVGRTTDAHTARMWVYAARNNREPPVVFVLVLVVVVRFCDIKIVYKLLVDGTCEMKLMMARVRRS